MDPNIKDGSINEEIREFIYDPQDVTDLAERDEDQGN